MHRHKLEKWVLGVAVAIFAVGAWQLVSLPEHQFASRVIIDDALYFLVPAQHLLAGEGFSFDGVYPTNGVQTLWALVTIGLAALVSDTMLAMRTMCLLSGLCWLAAGLVLYRGLTYSDRPMHRNIALFVACGWLMSAFTGRVAFQGMENGLHGLLFALIVVAGMRLRDARRWSAFGVLLGLFALSRTESTLLAAMVCVAIWLGWLRPVGAPRGLQWGAALRCFVPVALLVGGTMLCSQVWFGSCFPISGRVKMFYEDTWGRDSVHGPPLQNLAWHIKMLRSLTLAPLSDNVASALRLVSGVEVLGSTLRKFLLILYGLGLAAVVVRVWRRRRHLPGQAGPPRARSTPMVWLLAGFLVAHVAMLALLLPHFTGYGTWYFAAEFTGAWLLVGWLLHELIARIAAALPRHGRLYCRWALPACAFGLVLATVPQVLAYPAADVRTNRFLRAARWLNRELPPGQRIGSLSAGLVGAFADRHTVYNLDGLIGSAEYFDEFLRKTRVPDFFEREGIRYFADYSTLEGWRHGISWFGRIPLERLRLVRWWRLEAEEAYAIWEVLPPGLTHVLLSGGPGTLDALAELRFCAEVLGRFEVCDDAALDAALASDPDKVLLTSIPLGASGGLRHVLVSRAQLQHLRLPPTPVRPENGAEISLGTSTLKLYGCDTALADIQRGAQLVVTRYWTVRRGKDSDTTALSPALRAPVTMTLVSTATEAIIASDATPICRGTLPAAWLTAGNVAVDTLCLAIPGDAAPGTYSLHIAGVAVVTGIEVR